MSFTVGIGHISRPFFAVKYSNDKRVDGWVVGSGSEEYCKGYVAALVNTRPEHIRQSYYEIVPNTQLDLNAEKPPAPHGLKSPRKKK